MFTIVIPTWNNIAHLKLCIDSIRKNSSHKHQITVHVNEGSDGTLQWIKEEHIDYTFSERNVGICKAVNLAAALATQPYIVYMNDDMYTCPGWDNAILERIQGLGTDLFLASATMIEPKDTGNNCVVVADFGRDVATFREQELCNSLPDLIKEDWNGSAWPPTIVARKYWDIVGGYSVEFSPGMSSDDDFAMKMWHIGCRHFIGIGASKVYHFQAKSTGRIKKNDGRRQFRMKWGLNQSTLNEHMIRRGTAYTGMLPEPGAQLMRKERRRAWLKLLLKP